MIVFGDGGVFLKKSLIIFIVIIVFVLLIFVRTNKNEKVDKKIENEINSNNKYNTKFIEKDGYYEVEYNGEVIYSGPYREEAERLYNDPNFNPMMPNFDE